MGLHFVYIIDKKFKTKRSFSMKKIIALLLFLSTLLSLTACGGKKEEPAAETPTEVTEATTPTPVVDMTPHVIEGKQAFWDQIFKKSTIQTASDSFVLKAGDLVVSAQQDANDNIFIGYYFNQKTRMQYKASIQKDMVGQNRGLRNACSSVISFATDEDALVEYTKAKIEEINQGEAQEVNFR